ncbi:MAG: 30S ribosomal protein S5 [Candidatus Micrarchaeota archaeon]|nr:30S ribosomal protein S5 [Candidatus Micrarchaeota archaeon]
MKLKNIVNIENWEPKTEVGKLVKSGQLTSIEDIFTQGKKILEPEIVDFLLPNLEAETLEIRTTQRMTDCGRKTQYRAVVIVGDKNGHVGLGVGKSEEAKPAIESATKKAKINIISVPRGNGSWEDTYKSPHSIPIKTKGKEGSVEVVLKPAPRGIGIAANQIVRKVLYYAGVKNVWSFSRGRTRNILNVARATINALDNLNKIRYKGDWSEMGSRGEEIAKLKASFEKS